MPVQTVSVIPDQSRTHESSFSSDSAPRSIQFAENFDAFKRVYKAARAQKANGINPLTDTYSLTNAFTTFSHIDWDALYLDGPQFGVEIEFDASSTYDYTYPPSRNGYYDREDNYYEDAPEDDESTSNSLAAAFYERGWTSSPYQEGYHSGHGTVSRSHRGGWRFEHDGSVSGGEMISPIMTDTTQSWETLRDVVSTIRSHGGIATSRAAGAHIHVDTTHLGASVANYSRLFRLFSVFEDVLFRLAGNPHRSGFQRGGHYCRVNANALQAYASEPLTVANIVRNNSSHTSAICTSAVTSYGVGHVEFRLWDASLDAAVIQAHVKLSVALVAAAADENLDELLNTLEAEPSGTHRARRSENGENANRRLSGDEWKEDTERFRIMLDTLFTRTSDKEQIIALFAMNKWGWRR